MAERKWNTEKEDDLPVYLARPGTADQVPRQKYGGLFCNVEGAYDSKTIDFDALSVGQRGSRTPRTTKREATNEARSPTCDKSSPCEESVTRQETKHSGVEIRTTGGKEVLQNLGDEKVSITVPVMTMIHYQFCYNYIFKDRLNLHITKCQYVCFSIQMYCTVNFKDC